MSAPHADHARASRGSLVAWRSLRYSVLLIGITLVALLLFVPDVGLNAFWNGLIPVAPALVVLLPGVWRNICPMATVALLPRKLALSRRIRLSETSSHLMLLTGALALFLIIPLRHVIFDLNGPATAALLIGAAALAVGAGLVFEWKSGWCSGLCPIQPVERLYGSSPVWTPDNRHCSSCERCVPICPDSVRGITHRTGNEKSRVLRTIRWLMVGVFPGYIYGWFHVQDYAGGAGWSHLDLAYGIPLLYGLMSLVLYLSIAQVAGEERHETLDRAFAALTVSIYYWFRIPALIGFGPFPGDGALVELQGTLSDWTPWVLHTLTTCFFLGWFMGREPVRRAWSHRPLFADGHE